MDQSKFALASTPTSFSNFSPLIYGPRASGKKRKCNSYGLDFRRSHESGLRFLKSLWFDNPVSTEFTASTEYLDILVPEELEAADQKTTTLLSDCLFLLWRVMFKM